MTKKHYNFLFIALASAILVFFAFTGCSTTKTPSQQQTPPQVSEPAPRLAPVVRNLKSKIFEIVYANPSCSHYFWKNRGRAYESYMRGMALMYAKQVCGKGSDFIKQNRITSSYYLAYKKRHYKHQDALEYYGIEGSELNTFTFAIGLGMRESNGKYCKGRDKSRDFKKGESAEAGIFQMSYVARVFNTEMAGIYEDYKSGRKSCELDTFKSDAIKCTAYDAKIYGSGEGRNWQALMKRCPAFAVEWAVVLLRSQYRHFGPIIRKEVEFKNSCRDMLKKVETVARANCSQL